MRFSHALLRITGRVGLLAGLINPAPHRKFTRQLHGMRDAADGIGQGA